MLDGIEISGLAICFGPLALTIIGFIAFAVLTDLDARRTYLRQIDTRPEDEIEFPAPVKRTKRVTVQTPSRATVTILPNDVAAAPAPVAATPAPPAAPSPPPAAEPSEDDLTRIEGIGPKMAQALVAAGLGSFEKVAAASMDDFKAAIEAAGMNFAPSAESWAEQAGYAAKGDWDGLSALQDKLVSGRYPTDE